MTNASDRALENWVVNSDFGIDFLSNVTQHSKAVFTKGHGIVMWLLAIFLPLKNTASTYIPDLSRCLSIDSSKSERQ